MLPISESKQGQSNALPYIKSTKEKKSMWSTAVSNDQKGDVFYFAEKK